MVEAVVEAAVVKVDAEVAVEAVASAFWRLMPRCWFMPVPWKHGVVAMAAMAVGVATVDPVDPVAVADSATRTVARRNAQVMAVRLEQADKAAMVVVEARESRWELYLSDSPSSP